MHFCQEIYFVLLLFYVNKTLSVTIEQDLSITWDQKQALDKFRELVDSDLTHDYMREDIYLIRWLRARNFDLHAAESMLLKNLDWRKKNGMDSILDEDFSDMESDYKYFIDGFDYQGRPVAFWDLGSYDFRRASLSGKGKRLLRYMDRYLEQVTTKVRTLRETEGRNITQYSLVTNLGGFNVAQHLCLQCLPMTLNFIDSYENHFPGACDSMFLINTPAAMEPVLQVLKNAVSPLTRDSLKIFGRNKEKWQSQVYREIPRNQLPPSVGGTLHFLLDFPDYMHYGNYSTSGFMPYLLGTDLPIGGNGSYLVQATKGFPNGTAYPWGGSSHLMDMSPWLNINDDGTMWLQNVHGYVRHYENRSSEVWGLTPGIDIPITDRVQTILDSYGTYLTAKIDQAGRNDMYKGLLDYLTWAIDGVLYQDVVDGKYNK